MLSLLRKEPSEPKLPAFEMRKCELPPLSLFRVSLFGCLFLFILFLYFHHSSLLSPPFSFILTPRFLVGKHTRSLKSRLLFHLSVIILYYLSFSLSFVLLFHLSVNIISFLIYLFVLPFFYLISQLLSLFPFLFVFLTDLSSQGPGKTSLKLLKTKTKTNSLKPWSSLEGRFSFCAEEERRHYSSLPFPSSSFPPFSSSLPVSPLPSFSLSLSLSSRSNHDHHIFNF